LNGPKSVIKGTKKNIEEAVFVLTSKKEIKLLGGKKPKVGITLGEPAEGKGDRVGKLAERWVGHLGWRKPPLKKTERVG